MLERGDGPDLTQEPLRTDHRGQLGPEDLDRHLALVLEVVREIHRGHTALTQLPFDAVAVGQGSREG